MPNEAAMFDVGWDFENASVQDGVVRNVLLCGARSKNGYDFEKGAFGKDPATLYDNIPVYLNHSWEQRVENYAGYVTNVKLVEGKPRGDVVVLTKTEAGNTFLAIAESKPPNVGMSHVAQYKFNSTGNVEAVLKVQSVDLVVNPATTKSLHEHTRNSTVDAEVKALFEGQIKDLQEKLAAEQAAHTAAKESLIKAQQASKAVCDERDALKLENDTFKAAAIVAARKESAMQVIKDSGLNLSDKAICSDVFVESVVKADDEGRKALIADRLALAKNAPAPGARERQESTNTFDPKKAVTSCFN